MPNGNAATGLTPRRYRNGSPWMGVARHYFLPATDATPLFIGDPVVMVPGVDPNGFPSVTRSAPGGRITGVVVGFRPSPTIIASGYRTASTPEYAIVVDDPEVLFEVQESAATDGAALTPAAMGKNVNLATGAGSPAGKQSGFTIDSASASAAGTGQLRVVEFQRRADNAFGAYAKWLVAINQPTETGAAGSAGV